MKLPFAASGHPLGRGALCSHLEDTMNTLAHLYPGDDALRVAASVAVQIAGIVLIALIASWTFAHRNAALRDGIWKAALALVCVAPLAAWSFQCAGIAAWRVPSSGICENSETVALPSEVSRLPLPVAQATTPTRSVNEEPTTRARRTSEESPPAQPEHAPVHLERAPRTKEIVIGAIAGIWVLGTVILIIRLVVGVRIVARLRRDFVPFDEMSADVVDRLRCTLADLAGLPTEPVTRPKVSLPKGSRRGDLRSGEWRGRETGRNVRSLPPIMLSRRIGGPATFGLWRPVVVLPTDLAAKMTADELHDALAHECAHALRRDASIALAQQIVAALYWLHPFIYILNRQLSRAREEVCDNVVIAGTPATNYARTLLAISQAMQSARGQSPSSPCSTPAGASLPESLDSEYKENRHDSFESGEIDLRRGHGIDVRIRGRGGSELWRPAKGSSTNTAVRKWSVAVVVNDAFRRKRSEQWTGRYTTKRHVYFACAASWKGK